MSNPKSGHDVFLSYARKDLKRVRPLVRAFESQGWSVWWDAHVEPGDRFHHVIDRELRAARVVVVVWSETSIESDWVVSEADEGRELKKLFPVRIDSARPPIPFRRLQTLDLSKWDGKSRDPLEALLTRLGRSIGKKVAAPKAAGESRKGSAGGRKASTASSKRSGFLEAQGQRPEEDLRPCRPLPHADRLRGLRVG